MESFSDLQAPQLLSLDLLEENQGQYLGLPANPRTIRDEKFELLKKNIQEHPEFLRYNALKVLPMEDGHFIIIGGNMRYKAMVELGMKKCPCVIIDPKTPIEELKAYVILDNSPFGQWEWQMLQSEDWSADQLTEWGVEMPNWEDGFEDGEPEENTVQDDDFDDNVSDTLPPISKFGDIFKLGDHRLIVGDSTQQEYIDALLDEEIVDCIVTDPPYNVSYEGGTADKLKIANDSMGDEEFLKFLEAAFKAADSHLKPGGSFYIWHADSEGLNFRTAVKNTGWMLKQTLIWNKNQLVMGRQDYQWKHEPCLYGWKQGGSHYFINDRTKTTVIDENKPQRNGEHPTMKPIPLFAQLIINSTKPKQIVLDMFGGSGTTIMAAEQLNRQARVVEYEPRYADVIIRRWEALTQKKAEFIKNVSF